MLKLKDYVRQSILQECWTTTRQKTILTLYGFKDAPMFSLQVKSLSCPRCIVEQSFLCEPILLYFSKIHSRILFSANWTTCPKQSNKRYFDQQYIVATHSPPRVSNSPHPNAISVNVGPTRPVLITTNIVVIVIVLVGRSSRMRNLRVCAEMPLNECAASSHHPRAQLNVITRARGVCFERPCVAALAVL